MFLPDCVAEQGGIAGSGLVLVERAPDYVLFQVSCQDNAYPLVVIPQGGRVMVSVPSRYVFPPGEAPGPVVRLLRQFGQVAGEGSWVLVTDPAATFAALSASPGEAALTPDGLRGLADALVPRVAAFDEALEGEQPW